MLIEGFQVIQIVDDFLQHPVEIRNQAIKEGFQDLEFQGSTYHTVNINVPSEVQFNLESVFQCDVKIHVAAFRQGKKGSPLHNLVHADNSCAKMACVIYLNKQEDCFGGTAFWNHKKTGWDRMPNVDQLAAKGYDLESFGKEWHEEDKWELRSVCDMQFNRAVIYPCEMFHSRWPWEGFGDNEENARLIVAAFFDLV